MAQRVGFDADKMLSRGFGGGRAWDFGVKRAGKPETGFGIAFAKG